MAQMNLGWHHIRSLVTTNEEPFQTNPNLEIRVGQLNVHGMMINHHKPTFQEQ